MERMVESETRIASPFTKDQVARITFGPYGCGIARAPRSIREDAIGAESIGEAVLGEEVRYLHRAQEHHVVIEIDIMLGKVGDAMETTLDDVAVESRQVLARDDLIMPDDLDSRVRQVEPRRDLTIGEDENLPQPGRVSFNRPQRIKPKRRWIGKRGCR